MAVTASFSQPSLAHVMLEEQVSRGIRRGCAGTGGR